MRQFKRLGSAQTILLVVIAISLLLLLLVPHATGGACFALIGLTLLPVFLFDRIEPVQEDLPDDLIVTVKPSSRPSLFQRPPPSLQG